MRGKTKTNYVVQDSHDNSEWQDYSYHKTQRQAESTLKMLFNDVEANWLHGGKRKWRIVHRSVTEHVVASTSLNRKED